MSPQTRRFHMGKQVLVVASGRTELAAVRHLLRSTRELIESLDIRTVLHGRVTIDQATKIVRGAWFERLYVTPLDKAVVLTDCDGASWNESVERLAEIRLRLQDLPLPILIAAANWHLEAWFFADADGLRSALGRSLGGVNTSSPDDIQNPKLHLRNILAKPYTSRVAGEIARKIRPEIARTRSPSFQHFETSVLNGEG